MLVASIALVALALVGHAALWVGIVNRWHGTGFPRKLVKSVTLLFYAALFLLPPLGAWQLASVESGAWWKTGQKPPLNWASAYTVFCAAYGAVHVPLWAWWRWHCGRPLSSVTHRHEQIVNLADKLGAPPTTSPRTRLFCRIPFNQLWQLHVSEYELAVPGLPAELEGLAICHLSDLHFSPRIERSYFDEVVRIANEMQVDLVALTGDVCDKARFIDWIPETLGKVEARVAKFFILGNHDLRTHDVARLRATMQAAGFSDVGGRLTTLDDHPIVVAGNERPWFRQSVPAIDRLPENSLKLLLSHSPDQWAWARQHGFDLMLAGHTHGGQIRFPLVGPVICPSWHGTKYSCGFFAAGPTLMHVSRGTASLFPYRLNCRPEMTKLVLRATGTGERAP